MFSSARTSVRVRYRAGVCPAALALAVTGSARSRSVAPSFSSNMRFKLKSQRPMPSPMANPRGTNRSPSQHVVQVVRSVEAADGLAHGVDGVGEGQHRVNDLEELRHHLDGEHARGAGNLHDEQNDRDGLPDVPKCVGQREHEVHVHEHCEHPCADEGRRTFALNPEGQIAHAADEPHGQPAHHVEQPASEVGLHGGELRQPLRIDAQLHHGHEDETGHPQGQICEEGGDAAAVVLHGVHQLRVQGHGRGHEGADLLRVGLQILGQILHGGGVLQRGQVGQRLLQVRLHGAQGIGSGGKRGLGRGQRVAELPQNGPCLGERGSKSAQSSFQAAAGFHQGIQAGRDVRQHAVLEGGRCGANSFGGRLRRRVQSARLSFQGVGRGSQVVRGRAQGVRRGSQPLVGGAGFGESLSDGRVGAGRSGLGGEVVDEHLVVGQQPLGRGEGRIGGRFGRCDITAHGAQRALGLCGGARQLQRPVGGVFGKRRSVLVHGAPRLRQQLLRLPDGLQ